MLRKFLMLVLLLMGVAFAGMPDSLVLFPRPQQVTLETTHCFAINPQTVIVIEDLDDSITHFTAQQCSASIYFNYYYPTPLQIPIKSNINPPSNAIVIGERANFPWLNSLCQQRNIPVVDSAEGYALYIGDDYILVSGKDRDGTFYGVQTLMEIIDQHCGERVMGGRIYDYPNMRWRAVHKLGCFIGEDKEQKITEIKEIRFLSRLKLNTIVCNRLAYYNLSDETEAEKTDSAHILYRRYHLEPIPLMASLTTMEGPYTIDDTLGKHCAEGAWAKDEPFVFLGDRAVGLATLPELPIKDIRFDYGTAYWTGLGGGTSIDETVYKSPPRSAKISRSTQGTSVFDQKLACKRNTIYSLSLFVKTDGVSGAGGASIDVGGFSNGSWSWLKRSRAVQGTNDWQPRSVVINSGNCDSIKISLALYDAAGTAWFDGGLPPAKDTLGWHIHLANYGMEEWEDNLPKWWARNCGEVNPCPGHNSPLACQLISTLTDGVHRAKIYQNFIPDSTSHYQVRASLRIVGQIDTPGSPEMWGASVGITAGLRDAAGDSTSLYITRSPTYLTTNDQWIEVITPNFGFYHFYDDRVWRVDRFTVHLELVGQGTAQFDSVMGLRSNALLRNVLQPDGSGDVEVWNEAKTQQLTGWTASKNLRFEGSNGGYKADAEPDTIYRGSIPDSTIALVSYDYVSINNKPTVPYCPSNSKTYDCMNTAYYRALTLLSPRYLHIGHDEVKLMNSDSRCRESGKSSARLFADDVEALRGLAQPGCTLLMWSDMINPYHQPTGYYPKDSLLAAVDIINKDVIQVIWDCRWDSNDKRTDALNYFANKGFNTIGAAYDDVYASYTWAQKIRNLTGVSKEKCLGMLFATWVNDFESIPKWRGLPTAAEYGWSWGSPPDTTQAPSPDAIFKNKGDIFSPAVANFEAQTIWIDKDGDGDLDPAVSLTWAMNLNEDRNPTMCYRLERLKWDWDQGHQWVFFTTKGPTETSCIDSNPYWEPPHGEGNKWVVPLYSRAIYRISAFDDKENRSFWNYDTATCSWNSNPTCMGYFSQMTAHACQDGIVDPEGTFHIVYTGVVSDTVVYYLPLSSRDTNFVQPETLGIGKFPTIVVKHGNPLDTLGVGWLSKGGDIIHYSLRTDSLWQEPYPLVGSLEPCQYSVPRMARAAGDTVHLSFVRKEGEGRRAEGIERIKGIRIKGVKELGGGLTLYYGRFPMLGPGDLVIEPVSSWTPADPSGPIDPLGAGVAVDFFGNPYLGWAEENLVKYGMGTDKGFVIKTIAASIQPIENVCVVGPPPMDAYNVGVGWIDGKALVRSYFYVTDTTEVFRDTIYLGSAPKNMTGKGSFIVFADGEDVFVSLWDAVEERWSIPETLSIDTLPARYPQIEADQFIDDMGELHPARFVVWTQKIDDTLYELAGDLHRYEKAGEYGITPYCYLQLGGESPTPFTRYRDGWITQGKGGGIQQDYGLDSLVYYLPYIEPDGVYRLFLESFVDSAVGKERWRIGLEINGEMLNDSIWLDPGQLTREIEFLPPRLLKKGALEIKLVRNEGEYVPCARLILSRFEPEDNLKPGSGGPQGAELQSIPLTYALYQNYPNPCRGETRIRFQVPRPTRVSLKLYDVSGRLVKMLMDGTQNLKPGTYNLTWDGRDDRGMRLASGVYFYRLEAEGFNATRKAVLLR